MASKESYINLADAIRQKTLESVPSPVEQNVIDVSLMMNIPTAADVSAWMFRSEIEDNDLIKLHGYDNSGSSGALVITPEVGFGPHYNAKLAQMSVANNSVAGYVIDLAKDDGVTAGSITIPQDCNTFDISYYRTKDGGAYVPTSSYYIGTNNVMYPFELDNTPIANFYANSNATASITINGVSVVKNTIKEICFGDSYKSVTELSDYFCYYITSLQFINLSSLTNVTSIKSRFLYNCPLLQSLDLSPFSNVTTIESYFLDDCSGLQSLDLSPFSNVTTINGSFLSGCSGLQSIDLSGLSNVTTIYSAFLTRCSGLQSIDLSPLSNLTTIYDGFIQQCSGLQSIDLSPFSNVTTMYQAFLFNCSGLQSIDLSPLSNLTEIINGYFLANLINLTSIQIGGVDWSSKTVNTTKTMNEISNTSACTLYADNATLAANFKAKMNGAISNWTVVINS
jgi:hypothetical protein